MNIIYCGSINVEEHNAALTTIVLFSESIKEQGHTFSIIGSYNKSFSSQIPAYIKVWGYPGCKHRRYIPKSTSIILNDAQRSAATLGKALAKHEENLVICYSTFFSVLRSVSSRCRRSNIKCLTYGGEHFAWSLKNTGNGVNISQFLAKLFAYNAFDGHICSTQTHKNSMPSNNPAIVIPTVMPDVKIANSKLTKLNLENKSKSAMKIVFMGRTNKRELIENIVNAVKICHERGMCINLIIIGGKGSQEKYNVMIENMAQRYEYVTKLGFLEENIKQEILWSADAFIHLREKSYETAHAFPTRLPEYLAYSKPVILSRCSPFTEILTDQKNAIMVDHSNSPAKIAEEIEKLYLDRELATKIGRNGLKYAKKNFTRESISKKLTHIIRKAMS